MLNILKKIINNNTENKNEKLDISIKKKIVRKIVKKKKNNNIISENVYKDLDFFDCENSLFGKIDKTSTIFGNQYLENIICNPEDNIAILSERQNIIKSLECNNIIFLEISKLLDILYNNEEEVLFYWNNDLIEQNELYDMVYFKSSFLKFLNNNSKVLKYYNYWQLIIAPVISILGPILFLLIPYLILKLAYKYKIDFSFYYKMMRTSMNDIGGILSFIGNKNNSFYNNIQKYIMNILYIIFYLHGIYCNIQLSMNSNNILNIIHKKLNKLSCFVENAFKISEILEKNNMIYKNKLNRVFDNLWLPIFKEEPNIYSDKGIILTTFRNVQNNKHLLLDILNRIGEIDAYVSITKLYNEYKNKSSIYSYANYIYNKEPIIKIKKVWHPVLNPEKVKKNNINIGDKYKRNIILTGPNACGKSTFIKALVLSIILSQTITITSCNYINFSPFSLIDTYLNIPDCNGRESLFEAEMNRSQQHINKIIKLDINKFSFVIMDEIFSSTNPPEGISAAYSIGKYLGEFKNSITIITTHFNYLTNLEYNTNNFLNYKILVSNKKKIIKYLYKLKRGISKKNIALQILEKKGFDKKIIINAQEVFKNLYLH